MRPVIMRVAVAVAVVALTIGGRAAAADDFGSPPSGAFPIIFNDHTVYAKPDLLTGGRVMAAFVKDGEIYVPLRSMFEAMGATVSASASGRTVTAVKTGATVSVTVGRPEVIVNGESRPLDVPPMVVRGVVLVPVRVLSEALGAYVQWVPSRRVVVVRYLAVPVPPPTAPPTVAPTMAPTLAPVPVPSPTPTVVPTQRPYNAFIQAAYSPSRNYSEFESGKYCDTILISGAYAPLRSPLAVKFDYRVDRDTTTSNGTDTLGNQYTRFPTIDGGNAFAPVFSAVQTSVDGRLEYKVAAPRIYVGVGYIHTSNNYGYPQLNALGGGIEKLPDLRRGLSFYGSAFYYPNATGNYAVSSLASVNFNAIYRQQYSILKYDVGLALVIAHSPVYVDGGYTGDHYYAGLNAPISQTHDGPYIGLGVKL